MNAERREWVRVTRHKDGTAAVTVTVAEGSAVVKWTEKGYSSGLMKSTQTAREHAHRGLNAVLNALQEPVSL